MERFAADDLMNLNPSGAPLLVRYDVEAAARTLDIKKIAGRVHSMWCYNEMLPAPDENAVITLGEGVTPSFLYRKKRPASIKQNASCWGPT